MEINITISAPELADAIRALAGAITNVSCLRDKSIPESTKTQSQQKEVKPQVEESAKESFIEVQEEKSDNKERVTVEKARILAKQKGRKRVMALLEAYGVESISALDEDKLQAFYVDLGTV